MPGIIVLRPDKHMIPKQVSLGSEHLRYQAFGIFLASGRVKGFVLPNNLGLGFVLTTFFW